MNIFDWVSAIYVQPTKHDTLTRRCPNIEPTLLHVSASFLLGIEAMMVASWFASKFFSLYARMS